MASSATPSLTDVTRILLGPILAGLFLNLILYGVSVTQFYLYYSSHAKNDKPWMKRFILVLFLADTTNSVFDMVYAYDALINRFGDEMAVTNSTWVFATDPMMTSIIAMMVQLFFAWRAKVLTGSTLAAASISLFAILQCLSGMATGVAVLYIPKFQEFRKFQPAVIVWLAGSAICDCLITTVLVWYLRKQKSGYGWTDDVVDRIIRLTVQTGLITAVVACIDLVLFLANPNAYHLIFNFMLAKLYTNSLLSSLNARRGWAYSSNSQPSDSRDPQRRAAETISLSHLQSKNARPQVFVSVESHQITDNEGRYDAKMPTVVDEAESVSSQYPKPPPPSQYRSDRKDMSGAAV